MEVVKNIENKLLKRREIEAVMQNSSSTPTRAEIKKAIAKQLKVDEDLVVVNHIGSYFGVPNINIKAKVYDDKKSLEMNARPHMVKRNTFTQPKEEANGAE